MAKVVGYWAVQVTPCMELIKFGLRGDNKYPFKSPHNAVKTLNHLYNHEPDCGYYMLKVFDNGQMVTYQYFNDDTTRDL